MTGWREKRREARWKRKARMRNLERINKNKKCLAAKIIWICSRLPWRRELKFLRVNRQKSKIPVAFREGVSWNSSNGNTSASDVRSPSVKAWVEIFTFYLGFKVGEGRLPWRRELKSRTAIQRSCLIRRLPWRRELRILAFRPYKCAVIERL